MVDDFAFDDPPVHNPHRAQLHNVVLVRQQPRGFRVNDGKHRSRSGLAMDVLLCSPGPPVQQVEIVDKRARRIRRDVERLAVDDHEVTTPVHRLERAVKALVAVM